MRATASLVGVDPDEEPRASEAVQLQLHPAADQAAALAAAVDAWSSDITSENTRRAYLRAVRRLIHEYGELTPGALRELRDDMLDAGRARVTVRQAICGVRSFANWTVHQGFAPADVLAPILAVPLPSLGADDRMPRAPTLDQVEALRRIAPARAWPEEPVRQARARLVITLLADSGIRVAEAAAAQRRHLQHAQPNAQLLAAAQGRERSSSAARLDVVDGKGARSRTVPGLRRTVEALRKFETAAELRPGPLDPLLPTLRAGGSGTSRVADPIRPMTVLAIARVIRRLGDAIELDPAILHPHAIRHAYALGQASGRGRYDGQPLPLGILQRRLGHSSPATTARYLVAVEDPDTAI